MKITNEEMTTLNDRLADVLVYVKGFDAAIRSQNTGGNKEARQGLLDMCDYITRNLRESKGLVQKSLE